MFLRTLAAGVTTQIFASVSAFGYAPAEAPQALQPAELSLPITASGTTIARATSPYWAGPGISELVGGLAMVSVKLAMAGLLVLYTIRSIRRRRESKTS